jgi:2'-5' RNA ligase
MIRAFIAVEPDEALRRRIAGVQQELKDQLDREAARGVRIAWVQPASMHLTLKFLGDIDEQRVGPLRDAIAAATVGRRALRVPLARLGAFPRPQEPRALWIGAPHEWQGGIDARDLAALVRAIEDCCDVEGVAPETRPFAPHMTLARIKAGERQAGRALARAGALDRPLALDPLAVGAISFMKSELGPGGARHTRLWELPLGAVS